MKNIHILPTDKPSRLYKQTGALSLDTISDTSKDGISINQHIYITSNEEIKEGDWCIDKHNVVYKQETDKIFTKFNGVKKIILTTDQDLIKDGVQAIDDEFLEWFVKNPSCEFVEVIEIKDTDGKAVSHRFISALIPKEEPINHPNSLSNSLNNKVNKQERSYSEEEVIAFGEFIFKHTLLAHSKGVKNLFEQFKKK